MSSTLISGKPLLGDFGAKWFVDVLYRGIGRGTLIFVRPVQGHNRDYFTRAATFDLSDPSGLAGAIQFAASPQGVDCYHKYNLFDGNAVASRGNAAIGGKSEVAGVVAFGLDLDVAWKDNKYLNQQQLIDICNNMPVPPSMIVGSDGTTGGLHVYWAIQAVDARGFPGGYDNLNGIACRWYRELARRIAAQGGVIDATAGLERLLRFPGMLRSKSGQRVTALGGTGVRHSLSELILEPDEVDAAEAKISTSIRDNGTSVIAKGLDELGLELPDLLGWLGWSERTDGSGMVDRPEGTSGSCTGIYASSKDGRLGITIRTPGSIKTLMTDPITGQPFETAFHKITWLSRESFYVMATEGDISQEAWKRAAKKFACVANEDDFQVVPYLEREQFFALTSKTKLPLANYRRDGKTNRALSIETIKDVLSQKLGRYPKSLNGSSLVLPDKVRGVKILSKTSQLFGTLHDHFSVDWRAGITKEELFESLLQSQDQVTDVETAPHFPPVAGIEYSHHTVTPGDGNELAKWLQLWEPATDLDGQLILGLLATAFWGGEPGQRPFFLIVADGPKKVGSGKTTLAEAVAAAANHGKTGHYTYRSSMDVNSFFQQLLTPTTESKRVVLLDNIKSFVIGGQDIEGLITSQTVNYKQMYKGDADKTNRYTWVGTGNLVRLSDDLATRCIVIKLKPAEYSPDFRRRLRDIDYDRLAGDVASFFQRPQQPLKAYTRFGEWDSAIRSRLEDPDLIYETNLQRTADHNDDGETAETVRDLLLDGLQRDYGRPRPVLERQLKIFMPNEWLNRELMGTDVVQGRTKVDSKLTGRLLRQIESKIPELQEATSRAMGHRGWLWAGSDAGDSTDHQLLDRCRKRIN